MNISKGAAWILVTIFLSACSVTNPDGNKEYDFDHRVHFNQTKLAENRYHIEAISMDNVRFYQLATFLLRQAYRTCGQYGFQLEILNGVEQVDERRISPSYIQPSLTANLVCPEGL